jgi:hypothetical protein
MNKEICIIAANCQGAYLKTLLPVCEEFKARYEIHYFVNYKHEVIPSELLRKCTLLIYQPLGPKWGDLSRGRLLSRIPKDCHTISFNYLTFPGYWPFNAHDERNAPDEEFPFGQFPYGDSWIIRMLQEGRSPAEIYETYIDPAQFLKELNFEAIIADYQQKQEEIEERRDQKMLNFILENFRKIKLFETSNHPAQPLCVEQANEILSRLGLPSLNPAKIPELTYLTENQQPIHPALAKAIGLEFPCDDTITYKFWKTPLTFREYSKKYIEWTPKPPVPQAITPPPKETPPPPVKQAKPAANPSPALPVATDQLIFLHIPKTAGSSLNQMIIEAYGLPANYVHYNSTLNVIKDKNRRSKPAILGHIHFDASQVLSPSHKMITFLRDPVDRTISAFEFMKSHPEVWLGKLAQGTISEFLSHPFVYRSISDVQVRLLGLRINLRKMYAELKSGKITEPEYRAKIQELSQDSVDESNLELAKERLKELLFVGFTHSFSQDVVTLFRKLDKPCPTVREANRTPEKFKKRDKYTPEELELIRSKNVLDQKLYEYALELKSQGFWD